MNSLPRNLIEITFVDHRITSIDDLIITTERLLYNQKTKKSPSNLHQRIKELVRENGRLRQEVYYVQEQTRTLLLLYTKSINTQRILQETT